MKKEFDKQYIIDNKGCYSKEEVEKLSFINRKTIEIEDILKSEIKLKDKSWFLINKCSLTNKQKADLAYELAYIVLPIFKAKHPNDKSVRECLEAIQLFNDKKISYSDLMDKRRKAYAADAAAVAAAAAAYAAYAADAAYAAAAAAAYAAAAADAAYAASYKSLVSKVISKFKKKEKTYQEKFQDCLLTFVKGIE